MALYSDLKIFHFPEKLQSLTPDAPTTPPLHVRLKPTNACNHRCHYCAYRKQDMQLGQDMRTADALSRAKMLEICQDFSDMGVKAVTFSGGGEPLLYPHLLEAAQALRAGGVSLACLTNGSLLQGALAEFFAHQATWIRVSMDGWDDASYTHYRGVPAGEFSRIMHNLEGFAALGGPCVLGVSLIVNAENAPHVYASLARLKDAGVRLVKVSSCIVSNDPRTNTEYHAPHFHAVKTAIASAQADMTDASFEIHDGYHDLDDRFAKSYDWCPCLQVKCVIGADARVYACQDKAYNLETGALGSLAEQSFKTLWEGNRDMFYRIIPSLHCNHHCVSNAKNKMLLDYLATQNAHTVFV